jgi:uncharacterized protein (DUF2235 family)
MVDVQAIDISLIMTRPSYPSVPLSEVNHRQPRTLVLCFDGTSNEFSERVSQSVDCCLDVAYLVGVITQNTNVVKLYSILKKDDPKSQLCYYQARASSLPGCGYSRR